MNPAGSSQQRGSHPFTEPTVIPLTKYFWKNGYNTMIGSTPITASAIRMEELGMIIDPCATSAPSAVAR